MIHYACDRCKRVIDPDDEVRYVVRMEVQAVFESTEAEENDDDRDHLLEIHEILERLDCEDSELGGEDVYHRRRFDLCSDCYRKFTQNPVGREAATQFGFSKN